MGMRYDLGKTVAIRISTSVSDSPICSVLSRRGHRGLRKGHAPDAQCHGASRLHDPFNAGRALEACRSDVSFDPAGCRSEIANAGDFWRPKACLMTGLGQGEPNLSRIRRAKGVLAKACSRPFVGCHRMRTCVQCKLRNHGRPTRQRMGLRASRHTFGQRIHTSMQNSSLAPRRRTRHLPINIHGRPLSEGRLGRKGAWGGR